MRTLPQIDLAATSSDQTAAQQSRGVFLLQMGFFAEAGPVQVFVSNHLIPEDFAFAATDEPCFVSADEAVRIIQGAEVRLRIVGTRVDATEIVRPACPAP